MLVKELWKVIHDDIAELHGLKSLDDNVPYFSRGTTYYQKVMFYFDSDLTVDYILDIIGYSFALIESISEHLFKKYSFQRLNYLPEDAVKDLNYCFKETGIGYQYNNRKIIKINSELLYEEITNPVINLLSEKLFDNANHEYMKAYEYYRKNDNIACMNV